jgi:PmbA protein
VRDASESVTVRLGRLEDVERSENEHIGLRVFVGQRSATIGSSDLSNEALDELAGRAVDMARAAPEDPYAGLAPQDRLLTAPPVDLDLVDPRDLRPQDLRAMAQAAEDAARAVPGVTNSEARRRAAAAPWSLWPPATALSAPMAGRAARSAWERWPVKGPPWSAIRMAQHASPFRPAPARRDRRAGGRTGGAVEPDAGEERADAHRV